MGKSIDSGMMAQDGRGGVPVRGKVFWSWFLPVVGVLMLAPSSRTLLAEREFTPHTPVRMSASHTILDEWGEPLRGSGTSPGGLIQILRAYEGEHVYPPILKSPADTNAYPFGMPAPDPRNPLLASTHVGHLTAPAAANLGLFAMAADTNIVSGVVFARVYNAPSLDKVSFYGDSKPIEIDAWRFNTFSVQATDRPLYTNDSDGDGLIDSLEISLGTDPFNPDTTGDGISDYIAFRAGLDPADPNSTLSIQAFSIRPTPGDAAELSFSWPSRTGNRYLLEYAGAPPLGEPLEWHPLSTNIVATTNRMDYTIEHPPAHAVFFRMHFIFKDTVTSP